MEVWQWVENHAIVGSEMRESEKVRKLGLSLENQSSLSPAWDPTEYGLEVCTDVVSRRTRQRPGCEWLEKFALQVFHLDFVLHFQTQRSSVFGDSVTTEGDLVS